jgi:hypothetical protein
MLQEYKVTNGKIRRIHRSAGLVVYRWIRTLEGGPAYGSAYRDFGIALSERRWEIEIYDWKKKAWVMSSGHTPEGTFRTCAEAIVALIGHLNRNPQPKED